MPTGVTMEPEAPAFQQGDAQAQFTVTAAEGASLGNFAIQVTGHPAKGADVLSEFNLTVVEK